MKSKTTAYLLWLFLGLFGGHKFYLGKTGIGILYLCTAGLFFVGWIIDLFTLGRQVDKYNINPSQKRPGQKSREQNDMYKEWEERYKDKTDTEVRKTLYIEYEDMDGNYSERYIQVKNVYKKGGIIYIAAYCFLQADERTFRADRILSIMDKPEGPKIKDIKGFLNRLSSFWV